MPVPQDSRHIANQEGDFAPQHQNQWMLEIAGLDGDAKDLIVLSLHSAALPTETSNIVEIPYGNETRKAAGKVTFEDIPLVVKDWVDRGTRKAIMDWRRSVYDPDTGNVGVPSAYKKKAEIIIMAPDGTLERKCEITGVWPSSVNGGTLDNTADEQVLIEVTLTYDKAKWNL